MQRGFQVAVHSVEKNATEDVMIRFDPEFCEQKCPICTRARDGARWARFLQRIELLLTFGGCPWGRARQKKYGVRPDEKKAHAEGNCGQT
jgi:hypothetical protein